MIKIKPFLKWPGGKFRLIQQINKILPEAKTLVEPFVGSGAVFLNTNFKKYKLSDANPDLINIYTELQQGGASFINECKALFQAKYNNESLYYDLRDRFNKLPYNKERAILFLYLNRHGYNGLCRYNSNCNYNVPFGRYRRPYFPAKEMLAFFNKAKKATFFCLDYKKMLRRLRAGVEQVVYCDPPYVPLSNTARFTGYTALDFNEKQQHDLAKFAIKLANKGVPVVISNHDTHITRKIYNDAVKIERFQVRRNISCNPKKRDLVFEILALFQ